MLIEITVEGHRLSSLFVLGSMECGHVVDHMSYGLWLIWEFRDKSRPASGPFGFLYKSTGVSISQTLNPKLFNN